jgi:hypothetical protein
MGAQKLGCKADLCQRCADLGIGNNAIPTRLVSRQAPWTREEEEAMNLVIMVEGRRRVVLPHILDYLIIRWTTRRSNRN